MSKTEFKIYKIDRKDLKSLKDAGYTGDGELFYLYNKNMCKNFLSSFAGLPNEVKRYYSNYLKTKMPLILVSIAICGGVGETTLNYNNVIFKKKFLEGIPEENIIIVIDGNIYDMPEDKLSTRERVVNSTREQVYFGSYSYAVRARDNIIKFAKERGAVSII